MATTALVTAVGIVVAASVADLDIGDLSMGLLAQIAAGLGISAGTSLIDVNIGDATLNQSLGAPCLTALVALEVAHVLFVAIPSFLLDTLTEAVTAGCGFLPTATAASTPSR